MAKVYKLWVSIEEVDEDADMYRDLCDAGEVSPVPIGVYDKLDDAVAAAESLCFEPFDDSLGLR